MVGVAGGRDASQNPFLATAAAGIDYGEAPMFTNIIPVPTAIVVAGINALGQAFRYREDEDARHSSKWRQDLAGRLVADLNSLDSLVHGFAAAELEPRPAIRTSASLR
jgi:hypothetical protein